MPTLRTHIEAEQWIEYDYDPPCPETDHNAAITICSVTLYGVELLPALGRSAIDELEELCLEDMAYKAALEALGIVRRSQKRPRIDLWKNKGEE